MSETKRTNTEHTEEATCPYCGHVEQDSWELGEGDTWNTCNACGATYDVYVSVDISYTTRKQTEES